MKPGFRRSDHTGDSSGPTAIALTSPTGSGILILRSPWRVLPHEWAFNAFLLYVSLRLGLHGGASISALLFLIMAACSLVCGSWAALRPTATRWRLRLLWYPALMGIAFYMLPDAIRRLTIANADARLEQWDEILLGVQAAAPLANLESPLFTDAMTLAYLFFFWYLIAGPAHYALRDLPRFRSCFVGLFAVYAVGFVGYVLLPASGPYVADHAHLRLSTGVVGTWALPALDALSNHVDAFPSIHVAVTLYLLLFDARHHRRRFHWALLPCAALWFSTLYLHYHYAVDVVAGLLLGLLGFFLAVRYERSMLAGSIDAEALR